MATATPYRPRYIDVGINLSDPIYRGKYNGRQHHEDDLEAVISRAKQVGCTKLIVTGSDFPSVRHAMELNKEFPGTVFSTIGIHPCSSSIFGSRNQHKDAKPTDEAPCAPAPEDVSEVQHEPDDTCTTTAIAELETLLAQARADPSSGVVAFGEFGLDYDRLHFCSRAVQLHSFRAQLALVAAMQPGTQLPLFLHSRAAHEDFVMLMKEAFGPRLERLEKGGVVHSFTGTMEEMRELAELGLYVGVNGCSLKTAENCAVVKEIPLDRLMLETDGPWCEVRQGHAGWKYLIPADEAPSPSPSPLPETPPTAPASESTPTGTTPTPAPTPPPPPPQPRSKKGKRSKADELQRAILYKPSERFKSVKKEKWEAGAMVKGRNEPCMIERIGAIVAAIKGVGVEEVCEAAWRNTAGVFGVVGEE